jgi:hypothetical protein
VRTEIVSRNMDDLIELNSLARALDAITELMEQLFDSYMDKTHPMPRLGRARSDRPYR